METNIIIDTLEKQVALAHEECENYAYANHRLETFLQEAGLSKREIGSIIYGKRNDWAKHLTKLTQKVQNGN